MRGPQFRLNVSVVAVLLWLCAGGVAYANVYPSGVSVDASTLNDTCGTLKVTYVLNEDADGDGTNPGVKIEVLDNTLTVVRTVSIARQSKGTHEFEWDGRKDDGSRAPNGDYTVKITAADFGYVSWTQISDESALEPGVTDWNYTHFERPMGISVNKNPQSEKYGQIYVSQASALTTVSGRACLDGIYVMYADTSPVSETPYTGGVDWASDGANYTAPWKSNIGPDDHLYVSNFNADLIYEFNGDMSVATQLIDATNKTSGQYAESVVVTGTQAGGDRKIYLTNSNYNDTARKGLVMYNLGANATATSGDTGTQYIGPGYFAFYPKDFARDSIGDWYTVQYRYTPGQAPPISKFLDGTPPLNSPVWEASSAYTGAYGLDIYEPKGWVAYGQYYTGFVYIFDMATGAYVGEFDAGSRIRDLAFDAVGNIYTVDQVTERLRIWSPPDGVNSMDIATGEVALNKSGAGGPTITDQPDDVVVCVTGTAQFSVGAAGTNLTYQWKKNGVELVDDGVNVTGATTANLTLNNVQEADRSAAITVRVCDDNGVVVSNPAVLGVGVSFLQAPLSQIVCVNSNATFLVNVAGKGTISYLWEKDTAGDNVFVSIDGATGNSVTLSNVQVADNRTQIRCKVTDDCGTVISPTAVLTVHVGPVVGLVAFSYVTPGPFAPGARAIMYCTTSGAVGPVSFQWRKDGVDLVDSDRISGSQTAELTITGLQCGLDNGTYSVVVKDDCGEPGIWSYEVPGAPNGVAVLTVGGGPEVCGNGLDDDCDGLTDCDDPDCDNDPNCVPPCPVPFADVDGDEDVDQTDFATLQFCFTGQDVAIPAANVDLCRCLNWDGDLDVDGDDVSKFEACASGPGVVASKTCAPYPTGDVVINEISYDMFTATGGADTDDDEFVELYNRGAEAVDIAGWTLRASPGNDYILPSTAGGPTWLAPGDYYVIGSGNFPTTDLIISTIDIWANDETAIELLDRNQTVKDTVIYERYLAGGPSVPSPEGGAWGAFGTTVAGQQSLARYLDGVDTNVNGYDFGLRPRTPGANNLTGGIEPPLGVAMTAYTVPSDVDTLLPNSTVSGLLGSFSNAVVINPAIDQTLDPNTKNSNVIPASPQGGNAVIVADTPGGDMVASNDVFQGGASYDLWVYLDTQPYGQGGGESTTYGIVGTTDYTYNFPNPDSALGFGGDVVTPNGNTGLGWVYQKETNTSEPDLMSLSLCDFGPGGDSSEGPATPQDWSIITSISLTGQPSGWHRLKLSYNATTGAVHAEFDAQTFDFTTTTGLVGSFYVGYRESVLGAGGTYSMLRPATFDSVAP